MIDYATKRGVRVEIIGDGTFFKGRKGRFKNIYYLPERTEVWVAIDDLFDHWFYPRELKIID